MQVLTGAEGLHVIEDMRGFRYIQLNLTGTGNPRMAQGFLGRDPRVIVKRKHLAYKILGFCRDDVPFRTRKAELT